MDMPDLNNANVDVHWNSTIYMSSVKKIDEFYETFDYDEENLPATYEAERLAYEKIVQEGPEVDAKGVSRFMRARMPNTDVVFAYFPEEIDGEWQNCVQPPHDWRKTYYVQMEDRKPKLIRHRGFMPEHGMLNHIELGG